jgi:CcmD family protein
LSGVKPMFETNPWPYIYAAFALSWGGLAGYTLLLNRRRAAAEQALRDLEGGAQ